MIVYRIRNSKGQWSLAGWGAVAKDVTARNGHWTDDPKRARTWNRKGDVKCHITAVREHCARYPDRFEMPSDWTIVSFEVKEVETGAVALSEFYPDGSN